MKKTFLAYTVLMGIAVFAQTAFAQHPKDSLIIESKTVFPSAGKAVLKVRVSFSNKDTLANITFPMSFTSLNGGAYAALGYGPNNPSPPREDAGTGSFDFLLPSPQLSIKVCNHANNHGDSPDTVMWTGTASPPTGAQLVLPGPRRPLMDIIFDTVFANPGSFAIDTSRVLLTTAQFVSRAGASRQINFVRGIISVTPKGDLNLDGVLNSVDVVLMLTCVFLGMPPPAGMTACDVNCSGGASPLDVVYQMNVVFGYWSYPCP